MKYTFLFMMFMAVLAQAAQAVTPQNHHIPPRQYGQKVLTYKKVQAKQSPSGEAFSITVKPEGRYLVGQSLGVRFTLVRPVDGSPFLAGDFKDVHGAKVRLTMIDSTLSDYHVIYPQVETNGGEFYFTFTPLKPFYKMWVEITHFDATEPQFASAVIGMPPVTRANVDRSDLLEQQVGDLDVRLRFVSPPVVGKPNKAVLRVARGNASYTQLEQVREGFAELVLFDESLTDYTRARPLVPEPTQPMARGGPEVAFSFTPVRKGYVRLMATLRVNGEEVHLPFGVTVE